MAPKTLAIATDLSERADPAMDRAILLAREHGCRLRVIHVVDDSLPDDVVSHQLHAAKERLQHDISARRPAEGSDLSIEVAAGDPFRTIVEETDRLGADFLIAGMHRKDTLRDLVAGTTIGRVIRSRGCPVLLVRNRGARKYGKIMVATDFTPASRFALEAAVSLAPEATFHLIHAYHVPYAGIVNRQATRDAAKELSASNLEAFARKEMAALAERLAPGPKFARPRVIQGSIFEAIAEHAASMKANLLAIGTHGQTAIGRMMLGSVAETLIADPPTDLLIARAW